MCILLKDVKELNCGFAYCCFLGNKWVNLAKCGFDFIKNDYQSSTINAAKIEFIQWIELYAYFVAVIKSPGARGELLVIDKAQLLWEESGECLAEGNSNYGIFRESRQFFLQLNCLTSAHVGLNKCENRFWNAVVDVLLVLDHGFLESSRLANNRLGIIFLTQTDILTSAFGIFRETSNLKAYNG